MKKIYIMLILFLCSFIFTFPQVSHAQEVTESPPVSSPGTPACPPMAWMCPEVSVIMRLDGGPAYQLIGRLLPRKQNGEKNVFYVVSGVESPEGFYFTTGDSETDDAYCLGKNTLAEMKDKFGYTFHFRKDPNPITPADDDTIVTALFPFTVKTQSHSFFFMWQTGVDVTGGDEDERQKQSSGTSGLEYGDFYVSGAPIQCASFRSDPFGRVFNESLKPVPGAIVSLYDSTTSQLYKLPGVPNPVTTEEDGIFNFNVEPGTTFLRTNLVNNPLNVHQNASLVYSNIYTYDDPIVEKLGKIEQRDIPVKGGNAPVLKLMNYGQLQFGNETRIEGDASWPLTIVDVMQGETSIAQQSSNKFGRFSFYLDSSIIDPSQQIVIKLTEVDLLTDPEKPKPNGKTVESSFDPIPSYLEGFAYDLTGKLMPNAKIQVILTQSEQVYYETTADANGYFVIGRRFLPIIPYYIAYTPQNTAPSETATRKVTIPEYAKENKDYLDNNKIDVMKGRKDGVPVDSATTDLEDIAKGGEGSVGGGSGQTPQEKEEIAKKLEQQSRQQRFITLIILLVCFVAVGIGIVIYLKKRKSVDKQFDGGDRSEDLKEEDIEE